MIVQEHKNAKLWSNICSMLSNQENGQLRLLPKLQRDRVFVTTYNRINVRLAV